MVSLPPHSRLVLTAALAATAACALAAGCREAGGPEAPTAAPPVITTAGGAEMVLIPAGTFQMGSPGGRDDEAPAHTVRVDAFLMDRHEVTQAQYGKVVLGNPSHFKGPDRPVEQISWADAALYCNKRSRAEGLE
ncbi:MAG: formylglycine-generating enzyme family protein, partial [Planctomycetes bacterium]|nr:formylglycine-generating enzyme family protein [Planctomycetota bacterium]